jgi:cytochrome P450
LIPRGASGIHQSSSSSCRSSQIRRTHRVTDSALECDFVTDISARIPIHVIAALLGVPKPDQPQLFRWTNETNDTASIGVQFSLFKPAPNSHFPQPCIERMW